MSNPYPFNDNNSNSISFRTTNGIHYLVYFRSSPDSFSDYPEFAHEVMTFGIAVLENPLGSLPTDPRIGDTVCLLVSRFFEQKPNGILYYSIDNRDKKQHARKRIFKRWYEQARFEQIERIDEQIGKEPFEAYFALLFRRDHKFRDLVYDWMGNFRLTQATKP